MAGRASARQRRGRTRPREGKASHRRWLLVLLAAYLLISAVLFDPKLSTGGDDAVYLILAQSIAAGQGYTDIYLPGSPPHTLYPFGFPLVLALVHLVFGGASVVAAKVLIVGAGLAAVFFVYLVFERILPNHAPVATALLLSLPMLYEHNHHLFTEVPFLCLSMAAVYLLLDVDRAGPARVLAVFAAALGAFLLRSAGIALVLAVVLLLLIRRKFLYAGLFALLVGAFVVAWSVRNGSVGAGQNYLDQFLARNPYVKEVGRLNLSDFFQRVRFNFALYTFSIVPCETLAVLKPGLFGSVAGDILLVLGAAGFMLRARRPTIVEAYAVTGWAALLAWPQVWTTPRFLLPMIPFTLLYACGGLCWVGERLKRPIAVTVVIAAVVALNLFVLGRRAVSAVRDNIGWLRGDRLSGYADDWRRYYECIDWLGEHTAQDAVVLARKPEYVYLFSGRRSFCYPFSPDETKVRAALAECDYVLVDSFTWSGLTAAVLGPVLDAMPDEYEVEYRTTPPEARVVRMKRRPR